MQNFNFHQHTYRCRHADLRMQDEDYVKEYLQIGVKKIAFTDHCPEKEVIDTRDFMRMTYEERIGYLESIKKLKEKYKDKIEILSGYEIEYLPGQEDNLRELKNEVDILILGQHFIYDKDCKNLKILNNGNFNEEDMNKYASYIQKAAELQLPNIIAHPDFFMLARKEWGNIEEVITRRICEAAEKYNIFLEINLNNIFKKTIYDSKKDIFYNFNENEIEEKLKEVVYPNKNFWRIAREYNIKVLYGLDTHFKSQILYFNKLVPLANKILGKETIENLNFIQDL